MSVAVNPPGSDAVVEIADDLVANYEAQGWVRVGAEAPVEKPIYAQNKAELIETANGLGLDADDSLTKNDLVELIEAARVEQ